METKTMEKRENEALFEKIRSDFPILGRMVNGYPLVYLDNAASSQKPFQVIKAIEEYYSDYNSNVHRGVHTLSQLATQRFEEARQTMCSFVNASSIREIIFTKGTTDGINLVASSFGRKFIKEGDEIIISTMEHHSNIVPWQMLCEQTGAKLKVIPINDRGELRLDEFENLLSLKTKLVSISHISNSLGTINPVKKMGEMAHAVGAKIMIDGAQAAPHMKIDVQDLDCDFYAFSGHKMFGPTGSGILFGKEELLDAMPPNQGGGEMIKEVSFEKTTYNEIPFKFEAGTPNIEASIVIATAADYIVSIGYENIIKREKELLNYATDSLAEIPGIRFIGTATEKASVVSFLIDGIHPFDVGSIIDQLGVAVRTGHHCTQPLMDWYNIPGTLRASFAVYNNFEDVDKLCESVERAVKMLS